MTNPPDRELAVFSAARQLPARERGAFLDEACAGDAALRQRVEELLQAGEQAGAFLKSPAAVPPEGTARLPANKPGDRIGRYKLLQQIGEGGCGVVYMAEQEEPVHRRVALKVIKLGMDTKNVIARFEAERQALALMEHPNIAKVLDAGATDRGRPFFVMELVRGIKITDYCDQNNLSTKERLDLFIQVCRAIQHAHQKGIIHRDIKPSNILVTLNDGVPLPKVIDFGIAKATHGKLTDQTFFTAFEQFIGTPAYMSPEQAEMSARDVDTRSDIYSLGVLLYELLTGQTPFDAKKLLQAGLDEIRRTIRQEEPARPSTCLSTMLGADLTAIAKHRKAEPPKLIHLVRGDLDWIVMKALEKDRTRRYETANGLAVDIQRHLNNEPVVARPPSNLYRFQKLVRRNKLIFLAASAVTAVLIIGLVVSTWMFFNEQQARQQAEAEQKTAETEAAKSRQVAQFLQEMLEGVEPEVALGQDTTMIRKILDKTEQRVGGELKNQPEVQAKLLDTISYVYTELGEFAKAEDLCRQALRLQPPAAGKEDETVVHLLQTLGMNQKQLGDFEGAETSLRQAVAMANKLKQDRAFAVTSTLVNLGEVLTERGDLSGAEAALRSAVTNSAGLVESEQGMVGIGLNDLGLVLGAQNDLAGAEDCFRRCLALDRKVVGDEAPQVAVALDNLGMTLWERCDLPRAEAALRQALALKQKLLPPNHPRIGGTLHNLSLALRDLDDLTGAETAERQALDIMTKSIGAEHPSTSIIRNCLATIIRRRGALTRNLAMFREALDANPTDTMTASAISSVLAVPSLAPLPGLPQNPTTWRYTSAQPPPDWVTRDFADAAWTPATGVSGFPANSSPRIGNAVTPRTNLWLRQDFELAQVPAGKVVFRLNRNHDGQVLLNGVPAAPTADWADAESLHTCSAAAQATLVSGRNVLAIHCQDADDGCPIGVTLFEAQDPNCGWTALIEEFSQMSSHMPQRSDLYAGRAYALLKSGRHKEAIQDLNKALELKPTDQASSCLLLSLLAVTGDREAYTQKRHEVLVQFARLSNPDAMERIARASLLMAGQDADSEVAIQMAHRAAKAGYCNGNLIARQLTESLAQFRAGQFAEAIRWAHKATATGSVTAQPGWSHLRMRTLGCATTLLEAMSRQRLGQAAEASASLAMGMDLAKTEFLLPDESDPNSVWPDGLFIQALMREARLLIQGAPAAAEFETLKIRTQTGNP